MSQISTVQALANNEIVIIAWSLKNFIPRCLGFELTRIYPDRGEERVLPAWVSFKGQHNTDWKPQTTGVWPVQKLLWRDLTARKRRDRTERRPSDEVIRYRVRPLVSPSPGLEPVAPIPEKTYQGPLFPLAYADEGALSNNITLTARHGKSIRAVFTNGILSGQWLRHALEEAGESLDINAVRAHMQQKGDKIREYLTGDVLGMLRELPDRAASTRGANLRMALYELSDTEVCDAIVAAASKTKLILSNSSKDRTSGKWDDGNRKARLKLHKTEGLDIQDRLFNNGHIGHNKFVVYQEGAPLAVMTGSTNWTPTGLCGQSNNAIVIESAECAKRFAKYWDGLQADTKTFKKPATVGASTTNVQQPILRTRNADPPDEIVLSDGTGITLWFSPNTVSKTKKPDPPPDLAYLFSLMRKAEDAIFFAAFLPSQAGKNSIIEEAIRLGQKDPKLIVYGAISDVKAMPNYVPPPRKTSNGAEADTEEPATKKPQPAIYDRGNVHITRAVALGKDDIVGDFEAELLKVGNAIIHDKILVVDPLSDKGFVALGSHNLGYKASYENDENLLIIRNNSSLVKAYAAHILDVYDHYRFRAVQQALSKGGKHPWDGFLSKDDRWLHEAMSASKVSLPLYLTKKAAVAAAGPV